MLFLVSFFQNVLLTSAHDFSKTVTAVTGNKVHCHVLARRVFLAIIKQFEKRGVWSLIRLVRLTVTLAAGIHERDYSSCYLWLIVYTQTKHK